MTCDARCARCICALDDHEGPHVCECGGSWEPVDDGMMLIHAVPGSAGEDWPQPPADVVAALFEERGPLPWRVPLEGPEVDRLSAPRGPIRFVQPPSGPEATMSR